MEKHALYTMTWKEIEEAFAKDPVVLIPMGSTEQQGVHTLTGDYLAAEAIAKRTAEASGAYYIPVIPFGCSEYFRCFPGTISLRPSTVEAVITDVVQSLTEHGVTKLFFINGHAGNTPTIEDVARKLRREKGLTCFSIDLWQGLTDKAKKDIYGDEDSSGHGGDPLTSVLLYLYPEYMRMAPPRPGRKHPGIQGRPRNGPEERHGGGRPLQPVHGHERHDEAGRHGQSLRFLGGARRKDRESPRACVLRNGEAHPDARHAHLSLHPL